MGYFPNGTSGMDYESQYCERCIHGQNGESPCPVLFIHTLYNYDQCKDDKLGKAVRAILESFIPIDSDECANEQCRMFLDIRGGESVDFGCITCVHYGNGAHDSPCLRCDVYSNSEYEKVVY